MHELFTACIASGRKYSRKIEKNTFSILTDCSQRSRLVKEFTSLRAFPKDPAQCACPKAGGARSAVAVPYSRNIACGWLNRQWRILYSLSRGNLRLVIAIVELGCWVLELGSKKFAVPFSEFKLNWNLNKFCLHQNIKTCKLKKLTVIKRSRMVY